MSSASDAGQAKILVVDDVSANIGLLRDILEEQGYRIAVATNGKGALHAAVSAAPDLILLDVMMPEMDGYETCRRLKAEADTQEIPVIFITARDEQESLLAGFRAGGVDYIVKPFKKEEVLIRVQTHLEISRLNRELRQKNQELARANEDLRQEMARRQEAEIARQRADERLEMLSQQEAQRWGIEGFVGQSPSIQKILEEVRQLQGAGATGVLISGESGTGKELIARALHFGGPRAKGPFVPVNCAAIPRELVESSFFGHVKGSFTGATADRKGYFELADGGTLFLDEIGDMPLELQAKLLRVLEEGRVTPVGGVQEKQVEVRVVAATNADLAGGITQGRFRQDLYFRLARFTVKVPPLRQRPEDLPVLAAHFLELFAVEMGLPTPELSPVALALLQDYAFPGNVRELKNIIEYALIKSAGATIEPQHLHLLELPAAPGAPPAQAPVQPSDEELILGHVRQRGSIGNEQCRQLLGVDRSRATYLLDKLCEAGRLSREGSRRWTRYRLP
ncbi:MAG: sigma-54-dependent Fis family transcriptional regulator [Candidatus Latescibacteria bacterium]|nr:sigma-54-dependent Fis family transcriptional regulator [Candidatus Latescibacterota bacterium]